MPGPRTCFGYAFAADRRNLQQRQLPSSVLPAGRGERGEPPGGPGLRRGPGLLEREHRPRLGLHHPGELHLLPLREPQDAARRPVATLCHQGSKPAENLGGAWNRGCSQGACHATIHAGMQPNHNGMWLELLRRPATCAMTSSSDFPGPGDNCSRCHNPGYTAASVGDHQPPTTTLQRGEQLHRRCFHPPHGDRRRHVRRLGDLVLPRRQGLEPGDRRVRGRACLRDQGAHLAFYSVDHAMNVEAVKAVAFTVQAIAPVDTTPPTTTSSFNPAANANFKAAQSVTLTATDAGSGVKTTYYKIDSGAFVRGRPSPSPATVSTRSATTPWTTRTTPRPRTSRTRSASTRSRP